MRWLAALLLTFLMSLPARAEVPGQSDAAFGDARDAWLAGDDLTALRALAGLAETGNTAARILLGRIASQSHLHVHVTRDMSRKERIALLRQPGGLSGTSWLQAAAPEAPLAQGYLQILRPKSKAAGALTLLEAGDPMAALPAVLDVSRAGNLAQALPLLTHPEMPRDHALLPAFYVSQFPGMPQLPRPPDRARLLWGLVPSKQLMQDRAALHALSRTLVEMPEYAPIRQFCTAACSETMAACTLAITFILPTGTLSFQTPAATLIPQRDYESSPRFAADLKRRAQGFAWARRLTASVDHCTAEALDLPEG